MDENIWILIKTSLTFVYKGPVYDILALVQIKAWLRPSDKTLSEPMVVRLAPNICDTRPQWVKEYVMRQWRQEFSMSSLWLHRWHASTKSVIEDWHLSCRRPLPDRCGSMTRDFYLMTRSAMRPKWSETYIAETYSLYSLNRKTAVKGDILQNYISQTLSMPKGTLKSLMIKIKRPTL